MQINNNRKLLIIEAANMFSDTAHEAAKLEWRSEDELIKYLESDHVPKCSHHIFRDFIRVKKVI